MQIEEGLQSLGLVLPEAPQIPPEIRISFAWTRRRGNRVYIAGHAAANPANTATRATTDLALLMPQPPASPGSRSLISREDGISLLRWVESRRDPRKAKGRSHFASGPLGVE